MKLLCFHFGLLAASLGLALPTQAQLLADARTDYRSETLNATMTPVADTHGTGTWGYYLATVNTTTAPSAISGKSALIFENNTTDGGGGTFYSISGTDSGFKVPAVSNTKIFNDSPTAPTDYLQLHPGSGSNSVVVEWTTGAGETGTLQLVLDLSRVGVNGSGASAPQGYDDFFVMQNGTDIYNHNHFRFGQDTGAQTILLTGVTAGTKVDFVLSTDTGAFGFNMGYLSADISAVPEPSTWAMLTGGLMGLGFLVRRRLA